jgi:membrane-bound serine protease (ClpP class)
MEVRMAALDPLTWAILLMVLGCALVVLEVFIPSGGVLSFFAAITVIASVVMAFRHDLTLGIGFVLLTLVAIPATLGLALKYWPYTPMGKAFLGELKSTEELKPADTRRALLGKVGVARSKMMPSGSVQIDGQYVDAVSQAGAIELGQAVMVVEVRANRVVVRLADPQQAKQVAADSRDLLETPLEELGIEPLDEPLG